MPTVQAFFDSDAFIRGLMGPFGCLPADAEFMTLDGWKRMDAYRPGDAVLCWREDGRAEFQQPLDYINLPCDSFLHFDSGGLVMALSDEHRVPHWDYLGRFKVKTAHEIAQSTTRKTIPTTFEGPTETRLDMSDDMIRFAVMMQADGHYVPKGLQAQVTVRKERKKQRIRQILSAVGVEWSERVYERRPTETIFVFYPPYRGKHFGPEWYRASRHQLKVVLDEVEYWDGLCDHPESRYFTADKCNADFVQYAAHANGRRAVMGVTVSDNEKWPTSYAVYIRTGDHHKNKASVREHTKIDRIPSLDGRKYCFTTPTGYFVARYKDTVFCTGNSGKSSACVMEIPQRALRQEPGPDGVRRSRWAVIRNSYRQLEDTTIKTFMSWLPPHHFGQWIPSRHEYKITRLAAEGDDKAAEIEVLFRALDRPDQVGNLLSLELTGAWINEGREVPWSIFQAVEGRVGRYPARKDGGATWYGLWSDTNPPDVDSEWYKFFEETDHREKVEELAKVIPGMTVDKYRQLFKQPSGLSPHAENLGNLVDGYYQRLAVGKPDEWVKIYVHGQYGFVLDGMAVWPEYSDAMHCPEAQNKQPHPVEGVPILRGWDFGLTPACVFTQVTPRGQWIVFDELVANSMGVDQFSDEVLNHCARNYRGFKFEDIGDPAGNQKAQTDERSAFMILRAKGIAIEPGIQTLTVRLESVRKPLRTLVDGRPQFLLHPRCRVLRRAMMGGYHFRRLRVSGERYSSEPDKNQFSHISDALQYVGTRVFGSSLFTPSDKNIWNEDRPFASGRRASITGY